MICFQFIYITTSLKPISCEKFEIFHVAYITKCLCKLTEF